MVSIYDTRVLQEDSESTMWKNRFSIKIINAANKFTNAHLNFFSDTYIFFLRFITSSTIGEEDVAGEENEVGILRRGRMDAGHNSKLD